MKRKNNMLKIIPTEVIYKKIYFIREDKVMLDRDLALLYGVETKYLKRQVKRNAERFPEDFMFELTKDEYNSLRCQIGTLERGKHSKYLPYAFTEQGIAMLSGVLNSKRAICVNIQIMRAFTRLRKMILSYKDLNRKIENIEKKYDHQFRIVFDVIKKLIKTEVKPAKKIGF